MTLTAYNIASQFDKNIQLDKREAYITLVDDIARLAKNQYAQGFDDAMKLVQEFYPDILEKIATKESE